jgi:hypothetical protein
LDNILQLNASGGVSYIWSPITGLNNPNIANPVASLNNSVNYTVQVTGSNGCTNTEQVLVTVNTCLDVENYPNPFTNSISLNGIVGSTEVKLYNALGEIIGNWIINETNNTINTENLRSGIYFLNIGTTTKKIIKH